MTPEQIEAASQAVTVAPRITLDHIESQIVDEKVIVDGVLTIVILTLKNGFRVVDKSAPLSPENFNAEHGRKLARDNCIKQIWPLEAYAALSAKAAPAA